MRPRFSVVLCLLALTGCWGGGADLGGPSPVYTGDDAKGEIARWAATRHGPSIPQKARNFYHLEGGSFNGTILYSSFDCESREDSLWAVTASGELGEHALKPWEPSRYAVVMEGPRFYYRDTVYGSAAEKARAARGPWATSPWDVRGIKDGLVYEWTDRDRRMVYYAIDFDKRRVYYHYESGGFPATPYQSDESRR